MFVKALIYGDSGVGKTTLLGTAGQDPRLFPFLFLDMEAGAMAIASKINTVEKNGERETLTIEDWLDDGFTPGANGLIDAIRIPSWEDFAQVFEALSEGGVREGVYKGVAIDSLSEANDASIDGVLGDATGERAGRDLEVPEMRDYQKSGIRIRRMVKAFRDLSLHVFYSALVKEEMNPRKKKREWRPKLTGQLAVVVPAIVDIVTLLDTEETEDEDEAVIRVLVAEAGYGYLAKDRSEGGKLIGGLERPTLPALLDRLGYPMPEESSSSTSPKRRSRRKTTSKRT